MAPMTASSISPLASLLVQSIFGKGVSETGKRQEGGIIPLIAPILLKSIFGKGVTRARKGVTRPGGEYNNMNHMDKKFLVPLHPLK